LTSNSTISRIIGWQTPAEKGDFSGSTLAAIHFYAAHKWTRIFHCHGLPTQAEKIELHSIPVTTLNRTGPPVRPATKVDTAHTERITVPGRRPGSAA
jgi:hypothetical protein